MITDNFAFRRKLARIFPGIYQVPVGLRPAVVVSQAVYAREVLVRTDDFDKPPEMTELGRPVFGTGILTATNASNREQRRLVQPVFKQQIIKGYADTITGYAERLANSWTEGEHIDITEEMAKLTMQIIGSVMLSIENLGNENQLGRDIHTALRSVATGFLFPIPFADLLPNGRRTKQAVARTNEAIYRMIAQRRVEKSERNDLLDLLLNARDEEGHGLTDELIRDELMTIFIAGHETVALALTWTLYRTARHEQLLRHVQKEVDEALKGQTPTLADLPRLPYAMQVFKESLRFYPPGHVMIRMAVRDTTLGGYRVPNGAFVLIDAYAMHHRPDYFPNPHMFDPARFTPENEAQLPRFAYLPFGTGPRVCIGQHFALMEAQLVLGILIQRVEFKLELSKPIRPKAELTLRTNGPMPATVHRRSRISSDPSMALGSKINRRVITTSS
jgi:cytochrome P450